MRFLDALQFCNKSCDKAAANLSFHTYNTHIWRSLNNSRNSMSRLWCVLRLRKREFLQFCVFSFTPRLTANIQLAKRRGSKHDEGALEKNVRKEGEKKEVHRRRNKGKGRKKGTEQSGSSYFLGVQRSLYGQAIFTTKPPGRAEVTRKVTRYFRHVTRRYSYSSPGKWLVKDLRAVDTQGHPRPCDRLEVIRGAVNRNDRLFEDWAKF